MLLFSLSSRGSAGEVQSGKEDVFSIEDAEHIFNAVYSIEVVFFNAIHIKALKKTIEDAMLLIKYVFVFIEYTENSIIDAR